MTDNGKTLAALLVGAAAGAVLGLLFAPEKGSTLRNKLLKFNRDMENELDSYVDEGVSLAKRKIDDGKTKVSELANDLSNKADEFSRRTEASKTKTT